MSEAKRVPLQTLEFPESLGHAAKKEKKGEKGKQLAPSFRFTLALHESNEKACPEFNYAQLLKAAEKKRRKELKRSDENATNGLDPFDDDDEEDKLRDMARRFEAKYGTATMGRKRHNKFDDYVDLGAGYDENDSFIDNTDAYDEIVPEEMTTAHGGFYINCGALEFKASESHSLVHNNNNNNNNNNNDEDDSSESSEEDTEGVESPKRGEKRNMISSSDEDETEDITGDQPRKKPKVEENGEKKSNHENPLKKKKKHQNPPQPQEAQQQNSQEADILQRRKEKAETTDAEGSEDQEEKKKTEKTDSQKSKSIVDKKFEKKASNSNGFDTKKLDLKKLGGKDSNIDDAIESVVNAARVDDESSRDTTDSGKSRGILGTESECDDIDKEEAPLPEALPEEIKEIVNKLKMHAENSKEGKNKFFNTSVNSALFSLEKKLRMLNSPSVRLQTYGHLARFLPCSKITLLNRAKKLYLEDAEYKFKEPMYRLEAIISNVMPAVLDKFARECQKVAYEKGPEGSPADAESSDDDDSSSKTSESSKIPKKKFPWTEEAKKLVYEIANARRHYFKILRPRKESMESFVATFMKSKVLPMWPQGVVRLQTLLKYASLVEPVMKKKSKKPKDGGNVNCLTSSSSNVCNSRVETSNTNSVTNQEREKTPTMPTKSLSGSESVNNFVNQATVKSNEPNGDKKQQTSKHKDKNKEPPVASQQPENSTINNATVGKISVVPTAQLMAQKPAKSHVEKFNLIDLTNSSLSITPVSDYHKSTTKTSEIKKDVVSITPYSEPSGILSNTNEVSQSSLSSVHRQDSSYTSTSSHQQHSNYAMPNQQSSHVKPVPLKHRLLQENADGKVEKSLDDKDVDIPGKADKRDKRRERCVENKQKPTDSKKRKKDHKVIDQIGPINPEIVPMQQQAPLSKEEQEQRQIEETVAATNFLSQIINDDVTVRSISDKRKDNSLGIDETLGNLVQPTEQEKDVQMVMRSLKELQELQEMKYSPSHSPVGGGIQKPSKSSSQYVTYQEDYQRLYLKKDDKLRSKEEAQW